MAEATVLSSSPAGAVTLNEKLLIEILRRCRYGQLRIFAHTGEEFTIQGVLPGPHAVVRFHNPEAAKKIIQGGSMGLSEGFMDSDWDTPDLTKLLYYFLTNYDLLNEAVYGKWYVRALNRVMHLLRRNNKAGSKRNIASHYDLGNAFYQQWLDETMTYSSALFNDDTQALPAAQTAKYQRIIDKLTLQPNARILEIGCGWGGFAEHLLTRFPKSTYVGLTLSKEQLLYARTRLEKAGVANRADVRFQDYRDVDGRFDHVVSIEMLEAVGTQYWESYFRKIKEVLKPNGKALVQVITVQEKYFEEFEQNIDFIRKYIFPGGVLPSVNRLRDVSSKTFLHLAESHAFGKDYARTLRIWHERFQHAWPAIMNLPPANDLHAFDTRFRRMWQYYLNSCEASFLYGRIDVEQLIFKHI